MSWWGRKGTPPKVAEAVNFFVQQQEAIDRMREDYLDYRARGFKEIAPGHLVSPDGRVEIIF